MKYTSIIYLPSTFPTLPGWHVLEGSTSQLDNTHIHNNLPCLGLALHLPLHITRTQRRRPCNLVHAILPDAEPTLRSSTGPSDLCGRLGGPVALCPVALWPCGPVGVGSVHVNINILVCKLCRRAALILQPECSRLFVCSCVPLQCLPAIGRVSNLTKGGLILPLNTLPSTHECAC